MKTFKARIMLILLLGAVWFLLTYPFDIQEGIAGAVLIVLIVLMPLPGGDLLGDLKWNPKAILAMITFFFYFLGALIKSNLDVAFRVLHPQMPINPGIVQVKTRLKTPLGRLMLANSITLTPGTITVDTKGEDFYIHWIAVEEGDCEEKTKKIVSGFERYLEVICG
ncbi:Na+/H+ antiporter subunit E [Oceanispirochaeta sp.]|jgi:multicomponent Na+:H+ antiporter subunit E|uniref:Na+/H+ antiporter subunit E n=1 Tax=Oceanispirochaeta sp. TaxID=2035350 RepID=UPI00263352EB|nr:Na+/H+ antiporter subunit E [Oceanispirochaeta sp.]MDA3955737.1 Na+/H+ antiporter subunit E [Oceanispirochaeta sp.]